MNISIPEQLSDFIADQMAAAGLESASEYVAGLIEREQERVAQQEKIEALLIEGLDSGEPIEATDDWWAAKRARLVETLPLDAE
ncbi:MAG: type II toxin-antitoxin system ParD family antitoxin [Cyanobacteria bacterium P01_F01_bin.56]